jgi:hypothetical protein
MPVFLFPINVEPRIKGKIRTTGAVLSPLGIRIGSIRIQIQSQYRLHRPAPPCILYRRGLHYFQSPFITPKIIHFCFHTDPDPDPDRGNPNPQPGKNCTGRTVAWYMHPFLSGLIKLRYTGWCSWVPPIKQTYIPNLHYNIKQISVHLPQQFKWADTIILKSIYFITSVR